MNVGFLDKVIYNEREGSIDTLNSTVEKKDCDCDTKLVCIYKSLDEIIAISKVYDHQTIVFHVNGCLAIPYDPAFLRKDRSFRIP
uniref:DUF3885 domain-containing protein n=1 Tax=Strongyloides venezuelensis TaxID=75913 RepID=A0A0K0G098_STRVS